MRSSTRKLQSRPEYYVQTGSMFENPWGVPHDEIVRMVLELPPEVAAQVVFGKYVENSGLVFTGELISRMIDRSFPVVRTQTYLDEKAAHTAYRHFHRLGANGKPIRRPMSYGGDANTRWYTGVDFARQTDFTVISTLDCSTRPARLVYWRRLNRVAWDGIYAEVGRARDMWGPNILFDASGPAGDVILDALCSRLYCPVHHRVVLWDTPQCMDNGVALDGCGPDVYQRLDCCDPYVFTAQGKRDLVEHLRNCLAVGYVASDPSHDFGWIRTPPIPQLEEEMTHYAWDDKKLETDCVFSLALAAKHGLEEPLASARVGSPYGG